jgi:uncharacterized membrane protein
MLKENLVIIVFKKESEAYQAYSEIKNDYIGKGTLISEMALLEKKSGLLQLKEQENFLKSYTLNSSLIGSLVGILGGPLGVLIGFGAGSLLGMALDNENDDNVVAGFNKIDSITNDGDVLVICEVQEENESFLDSYLKKFDTNIIRRSLSAVEEEILAIKEYENIKKKQQKNEEKEKRKEKRKEKFKNLKNSN